MIVCRLLSCSLTSSLLLFYFAYCQEEKQVLEEINATGGKFVDTAHVSNGSEILSEIHRLRALIDRETDLRLGFEQTFLVHLNTLRGLESQVNRCGETRGLVNTNIKWLRNLEHRINMINSSFSAFLSSDDRGCLSGKVRAHEYPIAPAWPVSMNITFKPPFKKTPAITYGVAFLDSEYDDNVRAVVTSHDITRDGFILTLNTQGNTSQWGLEASWMACPSR